MVLKIKRGFGGFGNTSHEPTKSNKLGSSGLHTLADDVIDIVLNSGNESDAFKTLIKFFDEGQINHK